MGPGWAFEWEARVLAEGRPRDSDQGWRADPSTSGGGLDVIPAVGAGRGGGAWIMRVGRPARPHSQAACRLGGYRSEGWS